MPLAELSEGALWDRYKTAIEDWGQDPHNPSKKRALDAVENEVIRRMKEAGGVKCLRQS